MGLDGWRELYNIFLAGDVGYREGCCVYLSVYIYFQVVVCRTRTLKIRLIALRCICITIYPIYLQRCNNNTILSNFAPAFIL